jgi:5-methylcytosine-specific restriction endonuclease McrA
MTAATARRCLVLNADYRPVGVYPLSLIPAQEAISAVWRDRAVVVEEWDDVFRSPSCEVRVPKTIAPRHYAHIDAAPKFCRRNVLLRDRYRCMFCGERFTSDELTFDHLIPRSAGGGTTWENILMACVACNAKKRNIMPNLSGRRGKVGADGAMRPLKMPRRPTAAELLRAGLEFIDAEIRETWADWLYWSSELQAYRGQPT